MSEELVRTSYLKQLEGFRDSPDLVKIITGVRRSGKSTLLLQFRDELTKNGDNVVFVDMEEKRFSITTGRELYAYVNEMMTSPNDFVLLDEVHFVSG